MEKTVKKRKGTEGFTLVELIVVIAILAILAGLGTVAYTGYITATRRGVDRQTVGDLMYAAQLADYANPGLFGDGGSAMIAVTEQGTLVAGGSDSTLLENALEDSVGDLDGVSLSYDDWNGAVDGATFQKMKDSLSSIGYTDESGGITWKDADGNAASVSYAANADELWDTVVLVAEQMAAAYPGGSISAGEYVQKAAAYTAAVGTINSGDKMGNLWNTQGRITEQIVGDSDAPESNGAAMAATMARNHAFAEYVKNTTTADETVIQAIRNLMGTDVYSAIYGNGSSTSQDVLTIRAAKEILDPAFNEYVSNQYTDESGNRASQAYLDGMIYYALMYNVNDVSGEGGIYDPTDGGYLNDIGGYVSVAGSAFSGAVDWNSMVTLANSLGSGNYTCTVVITAAKENGQLTFKVSPADADPRDGDETVVEVAPTEETTSMTISIDESGNATVSPTTIARKWNNNVTLQVTPTLPSGWSIIRAEIEMSVSGETSSDTMTTGTAGNVKLQNFTAIIPGNGQRIGFSANQASPGTYARVNITLTLSDASSVNYTVTLPAIQLWAIEG